jgi:3-hydroxymyristoyl/3-hydroxydecanoyl-(acyl carrier protein) dehydratase
MTEHTAFELEDILRILPHRPPFLFVDRVIKLVPDRQITAERELRLDEPYFAGHFPEKPIMPGVLVTDALAQTSGLLWGLSRAIENDTESTAPELFYLATASMKYTNPASPGETLRLFAQVERVYDRFHSFSVEATVGRRLIAQGSLTLAMKEGTL